MAGVILSTRPCVGILGAGTQGRRLAFMWTRRGNDVQLIDPDQGQLESSLQAVEELRAQNGSSDGGNWSRPGNVIVRSPDALEAVLQKCWLVVECLPEKLLLKRDIIAQLDEVAPSETIIASNSSSHTCGEIITGLNLKNESRVLSAHTYWPPEVSVIEIMGHGTTSKLSIDVMQTQCINHGFQVFRIQTPSMGYLYNRIWAAIKREALLAAAEGAGTPEEIDFIFKAVLQTPKGPFEQMDVVGLDVVHDIEQHYADARPGTPAAPREYLKTYLDRGWLGVKTGKGFFEYQTQPR